MSFTKWLKNKILILKGITINSIQSETILEKRLIKQLGCNEIKYI